MTLVEYKRCAHCALPIQLNRRSRQNGTSRSDPDRVRDSISIQRAYAAAAEKVRDFDKSKGDLVVQQADKATGLPLWVIEVIDPQEGTW